MKRVLVWAGLLLLIGGCSGQDESYMPLAKGIKWRYNLVDAVTYYGTFQVVEEAPVGSAKGWRITSDLGESRAAWSGGRLTFGMLSGTVYDPPIPLLEPSKALEAQEPEDARTNSLLKTPGKKLITWKGRVLSGGEWTPATATLVQQFVDKDDPDLRFSKSGGKAVRSHLKVEMDGDTTTVTTVFRERIGIIRQSVERPGAKSPMNLVYDSGGEAPK